MMSERRQLWLVVEELLVVFLYVCVFTCSMCVCSFIFVLMMLLPNVAMTHFILLLVNLLHNLQYFYRRCAGVK